MPTLSWKSFARAEPERQFVALLSYLPLRSGWQIPQFLLHTLGIMVQLRRSRGLVGYSLRADLSTRQFYTLSAWEDEAALGSFVRAEPHARTMTTLAPYMGPTNFIHWTVKGSELPVSWEGAITRLERKLDQTISTESDLYDD